MAALEPLKATAESGFQLLKNWQIVPNKKSVLNNSRRI
jgi:hypothetical protein